MGCSPISTPAWSVPNATSESIVAVYRVAKVAGGVISAGDRDVERIQAIFHQTHPGSSEAADHRPAGRVAESRVLNTWLTRKRLGDGGAHVSGQGFSLEG